MHIKSQDLLWHTHVNYSNLALSWDIQLEDVHPERGHF